VCVCVCICVNEKERERDTFSMSESKVTIFLPTFRKKYIFIISFIFDYIPFVIEISAPLRESPLCRKPSIAMSTSIVWQFLPSYTVHLAADIFFFCDAARNTLIKVNYVVLKIVDKVLMSRLCFP